MLNKLIKIDLRSILRNAPILFNIGLFFALVSFGFAKFGDSAITEVIADVSKNFALSFAISGIINVISGAIGVFWKKLYSDESYLTHTLPLSKKTIYLSKILATFHSFLLALVAALIVLMINYNLFENFDALKNFVEATAGITGGNVIEFLVLIICLGFLEITMLVSTIFFAIIMKNRASKPKVALTTAGVYLSAQVVFILALFLIGLNNPEVLELFESSNPSITSATAMKTVFYTGIIVYLISTLFINHLNIRLLEKGINVA